MIPGRMRGCKLTCCSASSTAGMTPRPTRPSSLSRGVTGNSPAMCRNRGDEEDDSLLHARPPAPGAEQCSPITSHVRTISIFLGAIVSDFSRLSISEKRFVALFACVPTCVDWRVKSVRKLVPQKLCRSEKLRSALKAQLTRAPATNLLVCGSHSQSTAPCDFQKQVKISTTFGNLGSFACLYQSTKNNLILRWQNLRSKRCVCYSKYEGLLQRFLLSFIFLHNFFEGHWFIAMTKKTCWLHTLLTGNW